MSEYKSQIEIIKDHLEGGGTITAREASRNYGVDRLSAVIFVLKEEMTIVDEWERSNNRYGKEVKYKRYSMLKIDVQINLFDN